jgi:hypothetical protein
MAENCGVIPQLTWLDGSTSNCQKTYLRNFYLPKNIALILRKILFAELQI